MSQRRLQSVDLVLFGQQRTFDFSDEPVELDIELPGRTELEDEIAAGQEVLRHVESLEVQLVKAGPASASVAVSYTVTYSSEVNVDIDDLEGVEDEDDLRALVEQWDIYAVSDAIEEDVRQNVDPSDATLENIDVSFFDENGLDWEE